jgi:hypothetical protein
MAVNLSPYGGVGAQFLDNAGNVLTGGRIETYAAGTTTPQAVYTDATGITFHPNPIILDASGRVPSGGEIWLTDGLLYKFVLRDSNNVLIATYDNIAGINSNFVNFTNQQEIQTATAGQTVFTLTTTNYSPGTNSLSVFVDGVNQYGPGAQYAYIETNSTTVTFVNGLHVGALVKFTTSQLNSSGATDASQVSYVPAGVGAVTTTVQAKLRQTVSVKDFGAVGDGIADDTVAINEAIESLGSAGGTVYFPTGIYMVSRYQGLNFGVVLKSNLTLAGAGVNAAIIKGMPNAGFMHMVGNAVAGESNISIHDLTLDHNGTQINSGAGVHALRFLAVTNVWIQRIAVKNSDHHGIVTIAPSGQDTSTVNNTFFVSDVYCENIGVSQRNGGDAIRIFFGADKLTINNVICNGIEYHGVHVGKGRGTVSNIQMFNCGNVGLELQSEGILASNIHIEWDDVISDLFANRPAAGTMGRLFWASDTGNWYRDNGVDWKDLNANLTGVWAVIRGAGYDPVQRLSLSNIKCVLNVTENTPYIPPTGDGVRISGKSVQLSNIHVAGLFRFGLLTDDAVSDYLQVSNMTIEGVRSDGIRLDEINYPQINNLSILSAGTQGGTAFGINLRNTKNTRVISSYINDTSLANGIQESLTTSEGTKVVASHLTKVFLAQSGNFNPILYSSGYITDNAGNANILASTTSVVVTHGLSATPAAANISVIARSGDAHGNIFITNITSTTFTINCTTAPANNLQLSWAVRPT